MKVLLLNQAIEEKDKWPKEYKKADLIICPGGIASATQAVVELQGLEHPTAYVSGKREYIGKDIDYINDTLDHLCQEGRVYYLQDSFMVRRDGWHILGTTLWPDFGALNPELTTFALLKGPEFRQISAKPWFEREGMREYFQQHHESLCKASPTYAKVHKERWQEGNFHPIISFWYHEQTRKWINSKLANAKDVPTILVSHHMPSLYCSLLQGQFPDHLMGRVARLMGLNADPAQYARHTGNITDILMEKKIRACFFSRMDAACLYQINHTLAINQSGKGKVYDLANESLDTQALTGTIQDSIVLLHKFQASLGQAKSAGFGAKTHDWSEAAMFLNTVSGLFHTDYWKSLARFNHEDVMQVPGEQMAITPQERETGIATASLTEQRLGLLKKFANRNTLVLTEWLDYLRR